MQNIQLYIEGNRMDMFKDESVSLTQTIQNVKDIAKVFTNFTKTFSLPASKGTAFPIQVSISSPKLTSGLL